MLADERHMSLPTSRALLAAMVLAAMTAGCGESALRTEPAPSPRALQVNGTMIKTNSASGTLLENVRNVNLRATVLSDARVSESIKHVVRWCTYCGLADPVYRDLTHDGVKDVLVPIDSGGSSGIIAFYVYSPQQRRLRDVFAFEHQLGLLVRVRGTGIVVTLPLYHPEDPHCCPYARETRVYHWQGSAFHVTHSERHLEAPR
jgi:hypothetical protein